MKTIIKSKFNTTFEKSVDAVSTSKLLEFIAFPILKFKTINVNFFPKNWSDGDKFKTRMLFLGIIPVGNQNIDISIPEAPKDMYIVRDKGSGNLAKTWDHIIRIKKLSENEILYTDIVEVKAGVLTIPIWIFANIFYRWR